MFPAACTIEETPSRSICLINLVKQSCRALSDRFGQAGVTGKLLDARSLKSDLVPVLRGRERFDFGEISFGFGHFRLEARFCAICSINQFRLLNMFFCVNICSDT